ncbi:MAG: hypothetical protein KA473_15530 [Anaerolineales bacterium]|nr:hypothetical protein [Anaerolineales bacterium]
MSKKKVSSPTTESTKIALYSAVIVAIIGTITATVNSYSNYVSNKVQIVLPIAATQTAEAKISAETEMAAARISTETKTAEEKISTETQTANISNSIKSYAAVIVETLVSRNLLNSNSGTVVWENKETAVTMSVTGAMSAKSTNTAPADFVFFSNVAWNSNDTELTACGFNFRSNNLSSNYTTLLRRNGNVILWLMSSNGIEREIASTIIQRLNKGNGELNNLLLIVEGNRFVFLVNDAVIYDVVDLTLTTGFVGEVVGTGTNDINTCTFQDSWLWLVK